MSLVADDDAPPASKSDEQAVHSLATDLLSTWHNLKVSVVIAKIFVQRFAACMGQCYLSISSRFFLSQ